MTRTGIIIVSHGDSGQSMFAAAQKIVGAIEARVVDVPVGEPRDVTARNIEAACAEDEAEQLLFLVDLEGSTPFNVCNRRVGKSVILSGVNLPILLKLATVDRDRAALEVAEELRATGQKSIHIRSGASAGTREP